MIALVVTIVVLVILSTVSINAVVGENGLIKKAREARETYENSVIAEDEELNELMRAYQNAIAKSPET